MTGAIVSGNIPTEAKNKLAALTDVFFLSPDESIASPVSTHPDMIVSIIGKNAVLPLEYAEKNPALCDFLTQKGYAVILSEEKRAPIYPYDTALNCAVGNGFIVSRKKTTDKNVLALAEKNGYKIIDVNQGYAGCSTLICDNAVITSDSGIYNAAITNGLESVFVDKSGIALPGYDVGFIGGCGGYSDGTLYFFGKIDSVECGKKIRTFAEKREIAIVPLSDGRITDYGGIKFLK